jgi:hypothetical protein
MSCASLFLTPTNSGFGLRFKDFMWFPCFLVELSSWSIPSDWGGLMIHVLGIASPRDTYHLPQILSQSMQPFGDIHGWVEGVDHSSSRFSGIVHEGQTVRRVLMTVHEEVRSSMFITSLSSSWVLVFWFIEPVDFCRKVFADSPPERVGQSI